MFCPFNYTYRIIRSDLSGSGENQLNGCLEQLGFIIKEWGSSIVPVKINLFFSTSSEFCCEYISRLIEASSIMKGVDLNPVIIAQAPTDGSLVQIILTGIMGLDLDQIRYNTEKEKSVVSIKSDKQQWLYLGARGCSSSDLTIRQNADNSFKQVSSILEKEGFSFSNILRQWNYIPDIVGIELGSDSELQNYQEFNELRAYWYKENKFISDFPAATGIGTRGQVVRLEIIAGKEIGDYQVFSLQNPGQQNAHEYSAEKLVGTIRESTPLFERGKVIFGNGRGHIWVSGTAAIIGEESVRGDVLEQTNTTCENIDKLIASENLINTGLPSQKFDTSALYIRAYVKYIHDGSSVRDILVSRYPEALIHVLEADVCREELLVEVEGEFSIRY